MLLSKKPPIGATDVEEIHGRVEKIGEQSIYMDKIVSYMQDYTRPKRLQDEKTSVGGFIGKVLSTLDRYPPA